MPEDMKFVGNKELLSYEEMLRVVSVLAKEGLQKVRITGGEPFLRKEIMFLFREMAKIKGINKIAVTSNATRTMDYIDELLSLGVRSYNISIDALDKERFFQITKRDLYDDVLKCIHEMMKLDIDLRLNCVVMKDKNIEDIIPFIEMTENNKISVRFIEEMPFNGLGAQSATLEWDYLRILDHISNHFSGIERIVDGKNSTSVNYQVNGFKGSFGLIPAYTRSFCGTCNRIRITAQGIFKTCLYDNGVFNIKDIMRAGATDQQLLDTVRQALAHKGKDGFEAEGLRPDKVSESMSTIGG